MFPSLDIIIVNWNAGQQLRDCLESIVATNCKDLKLNQVVVVDNASTDGSVNNIQDIDLPLRLIHNQKNRGFAAACNQGAKNSQSDYLLFLNPDTRLFEDSLNKPIHFMAQPKNKNIGICGIQLVNDQGEVTRSCTRFPSLGVFLAKMLGFNRLVPHRFPSHFMIEWDHSDSREVNQIIGAFFLMRCSIFKSLDGFDERFFVYLEDLDFSYRSHCVGWQSFYLTEGQAYHKGGGTSEQIKATRLFYSLRSRIKYGYKHFGVGAGIVLMLATLLIEPISRLVLAVSGGKFSQIKETLQAYFRLWKYLLNLRYRRENNSNTSE